MPRVCASADVGSHIVRFDVEGRLPTEGARTTTTLLAE
jgi:hypothetical protein